MNVDDQATQAIAKAAAEARRRKVLVVVEGPDVGQTFALDPSAPQRILVGTSPACSIRLTDPTVSRRHAAFEIAHGEAYRLTDLGSTNGTFVDSTQIVEGYVRGGELVHFGSTAVRVEEEETNDIAAPLPTAMRFGRTLGASPAMRRLYPLCERLAATRVPVIIEGETGTGKEVLAESIHEMSNAGAARLRGDETSARGAGTFVVFDCTTVASNLLEAELFGYERGAFTGADRTRPGVFEEADGGTLLIDEIGDLDLPLQAKLLRLIDRGELRRVGGQKTIRADVRVLAATRRDLDKEVAAGRFRDDLFHRLAVARIELPPLRERTGDVPLLTRQFVRELGGPPALVDEILKRYADYTWPGNVRELRNLVARYVALGAEAADLLHRPQAPAATLPPSPPTTPSMPAPARMPFDAAPTIDEIATLPYPLARRKALEDFERRYVAAVLAKHGGNVSHAAKASGLALRYFRLMKSRTRAE